MRCRSFHTSASTTSVLLIAGAALVGGCQQENASATTIPKDDVITAHVKSALVEDPRVSESEIKVVADDGIVKLSGQVYNLAGKRYAIKEAEKIAGVRGVIDKIKVKPANQSDGEITDNVRRRLDNDATIQSIGLEATTHNGTVTLQGEVSSWEERQEAELVATEVAGVQSVVNNLRVEYKDDRSDDAVQQDITASLERDVYLAGLPIEATVKEGVVTLSGRVGNPYQKERAGDDAQWVRNVGQVRNNLQVKPWEDNGARKAPPTPSDNELKQAVRDELYQDFRIADPFEVNVEAKYGHVTLRGTLPSYKQKQLIAEDARDVAGVVWVTNLIDVKTDWRNDDAIYSDVQFDFQSDYLLKNKPVQFTVDDGVVTLTGEVNTSYEKSHARELASRVPGVKDIVNDITVKWSPTYTDEALKERIEDRLSSDAETRFAADQINVQVRNGEATLTGDVSFWSARREAGRIALMTEGVKLVDNQLTVDGVKYPWDEWHYPTETAGGPSSGTPDLDAGVHEGNG